MLNDVCEPTDSVDIGLQGGPKGGRSMHSVGSELFICKVIKVEKGPRGAGERPLLYWKQRYATVKDDI